MATKRRRRSTKRRCTKKVYSRKVGRVVCKKWNRPPRNKGKKCKVKRRVHGVLRCRRFI